MTDPNNINNTNTTNTTKTHTTTTDNNNNDNNTITTNNTNDTNIKHNNHTTKIQPPSLRGASAAPRAAQAPRRGRLRGEDTYVCIYIYI